MREKKIYCGKHYREVDIYMDKYGISLTNADGSMKTFREVIDNLRSSLGGLSESEQVAAATAIFGKESFAGMLAIVNASDADFKKLSDSVNNAAGAAERMAQIKLDNFEGKVTLLKSAFEGLQIALGDALLPTFTQGAEKAAELISKLTEFINANPELVRTIVKVTAGLLAFKAAALTAKLGFLELKGGVLTIQKVMALFKGKTALAGVEAVGFAGKVKGVAKSVTGYFGGIGSAAGGVGRAFGQMFSGTKIGGAFSKIGGAAGGVFSKMFSG
ncbi:phage tail tape measure protein, partial [Dysosmobacter sp.]|uniref:phage tail tape measure protein n=1 Tax=Dysosmobacter sp. TaxID=2591382 RepID=UPI00406DB299